METCKICNETFKNIKSLSSHIAKHKISSQEYYDKFILEKGKGKCEVCGNETSYRNLTIGYLNNCSMECRNKNKNIKRDSLRGRKQNKEQIKKRIENTDQKNKEKNRKATMLNKYGVDNPTKLSSIVSKIRNKLIGTKKNRTKEWQRNIIESKRKNGTLKHSENTKEKIKKTLNKYFSENLDREKYITKCNNVNHLSGWYNGLYFRSSLELSFLFNNKEKIFYSCENKKYRVLYDDNDKKRAYYPDYTDGVFIYEIKPSSLINYKFNTIKIEQGREMFKEKYKLITEKECPYIEKKTIFNLIENKIVVLTKTGEKSLEKYKK
jgi:hypothetical protein